MSDSTLDGYHRIEPILYEYVESSTSRQSVPSCFRDLTQVPIDEPSKIRRGKHVRHLLMGNNESPHQVAIALSIFPHVISLALWNTRLGGPDRFGLTDNVVHMRLRRLSISMRLFLELFSALPQRGSRLRVPWTQELTHLELSHVDTTYWPLSDWPYHHFTSLTHLAFDFDVPVDRAMVDFLREMSSTKGRLEIILLLLSFYTEEQEHYAWTYLENAGFNDPRIVALACAKIDFAVEWRAQVTGGHNMWHTADTRRRKRATWERHTA